MVLGLLLSLSAKADDIRDFEIEGVSIGESLLDKYNKNVLDNIEKYYYPNSKKNSWSLF